ncbi:hypothetical protein MIH18_15515 [Marinobacter sp. M3C]|uniref:HD domain-containing phosphohydrolase n=1 Tax=Marinobacter sp. M3C TaxID=2917715 RepID=UPI00200EE700|nr:HD domain-containing phosphohydrolase [Marinobacter sp. M3C]UQG59153.1 hypothetical protein MIH18_15515 [Marinobacter sp. M3C]
MKYQMCLVSNDRSLIKCLSQALQPLGIEIGEVSPSHLWEVQSNCPVGVTVVDLESFDGLSAVGWRDMRKSLEHTLCVPLLSKSNDNVIRQWFGTDAKCLTKPITSAQMRWLVLQCISRQKGATLKMSDSRRMGRHAALGLDSLSTLQSILKHRNPEKAENQDRVAELIAQIAKRCQIDTSVCEAVVGCARVYDIGALIERVGPSAKRRPNSPARRAFHSAALVKLAGGSTKMVQLLRNLDENWDGSGVPANKKGTEIPIGSRMLRIAIDFIRLQHCSEKQLYLNFNESLALLRDSAGTLYDPGLITRFLEHAMNSVEGAQESTIWICGARHLLPGMRLSENLYGQEGLMLLSKGNVLNERLVTRLLNYEERFYGKDELFAAVFSGEVTIKQAAY